MRGFIVLADELSVVGDGLLISPCLHLETVVMLIEALVLLRAVRLQASKWTPYIRYVLFLDRVLEDAVEVLGSLRLRVPCSLEVRVREESRAICPEEGVFKVRHQVLLYLCLVGARQPHREESAEGISEALHDEVVTLLPTEAHPNDCLRAYIEGEVCLEGNRLCAPHLPPIDFELQISVIKADHREAVHWASTIDVRTSLRLIRLVVVLRSATKGKVLGRIQEFFNGALTKRLVFTPIENLTCIGVTEDEDSTYKVIVLLRHLCAVGVGILIAQG